MHIVDYPAGLNVFHQALTYIQLWFSVCCAKTNTSIALYQQNQRSTANAFLCFSVKK